MHKRISVDNNKEHTNQQEKAILTLFGKNIQRKQLIQIFIIIAILLGSYQAWDTRHHINPDGLSYLDMGDAYIRGDWDLAINAYWSPFYSWLTGIALFIIKPSPYWEATVIHLLNLIIYLSSMLCFHFFLTQLIQYNKRQIQKDSKRKYQSLPEWGWIILGYSLFIWTSLNMITLIHVTPDMCIAGFVYLASALLIKMHLGYSNILTSILFGLVLGFGYLAKVPFLPIAIIFLVSSIFLIGNFRKNWPQILAICLSFSIVCGSFITILSIVKGRFTLGDSGKLNYAWFVNDTSRYSHWQGDEPGSGIPTHPTRKIFDMPPIYEFETPIQGTYPPWYDPSFWNEGISLNFHIKKQITLSQDIIENYYFELFFHSQTALMVGFLLFFMTGWKRPVVFKNILRQWFLILPAIAPMLMFSLVHVESRFLGAYIVLLWLALFSGVNLPKSIEATKWVKNAILTISIILMTINIFPFGMRSYHLLANLVGGRELWPHENYQVAQGLKQLDIHPGDKVAFIGHTFNGYWARLAKIKIIAEIPHENIDSFWTADSKIQNQVYNKFSDTNAKAILTTEVPSYASMSDWQRIGNTDYFFYDLRDKTNGEL